MDALRQTGSEPALPDALALPLDLAALVPPPLDLAALVALCPEDPPLSTPVGSTTGALADIGRPMRYGADLAAVVRQWHAEGTGIGTIAKRLTAAGVPTKRGTSSTWHNSGVERLLAAYPATEE